MHGDGERNQTLLLLTESLEALRLADSTLLSAAIGLGWIGTGMLTYAAREDNSMAEGDALNEMGLQCTTTVLQRNGVLGDRFWDFGQGDSWHLGAAKGQRHVLNLPSYYIAAS